MTSVSPTVGRPLPRPHRNVVDALTIVRENLQLIHRDDRTMWDVWRVTLDDLLCAVLASGDQARDEISDETPMWYLIECRECRSGPVPFSVHADREAWWAAHQKATRHPRARFWTERRQ